MLNQINLESFEHGTRIVKRAETKLIEFLEKRKEFEYKLDKKSLLKLYKINNNIENELKHLVNVLDNHIPSIDKEIVKFKDEIVKFKDEIASIGLKNKQEQISCLIRKEDEDSSTIE